MFDTECASSLGLQAVEGKREARQGFFGRHRSISNRSAGTPAVRTFPHCARVSRSVPCTNSLSGATCGRPVFLRSSMPGLSVAQERLATGSFSCHNNAMQTAVKTLKVRVKDKHASVLRRMARDVNQVFNFANETSSRAIRERGKWLSAYDLQKLTAGYSKCDGVTVGSGTVQLVCVEYATRRKQFKKTRLNWRVSNPKSPKYSLGWIPFKGGHAKCKAGQIHFGGHKFSLWDSYGLSRFELRAGSFSEDSRGPQRQRELRCAVRPWNRLGRRCAQRTSKRTPPRSRSHRGADAMTMASRRSRQRGEKRDRWKEPAEPNPQAR